MIARDPADPWAQLLRELEVERRARAPQPAGPSDDSPDAQAVRRAQAADEYERWRRTSRQRGAA